MDRSIQHAWQAQIHAVDLAAIQLLRRIQPWDGFTDELPILRVLQRNIRGRREACRRFRNLAKAGAAPAWPMGDDAIGRAAFARRNTLRLGSSFSEPEICHKSFSR
jgi:hypothetical protein